MAGYQNVFERIEKKYMLTIEQFEALQNGLDKYMQQDEYGLHTIHNIYYDTANFGLIRASIEKPVYKEKLRLRSYGTPTADSTVFLELKKKFDGVVYKRRIAMTLKEARDYLEQGIRYDEGNQILNEIDWFIQIHQPLPKVFIAYDRIALFGRSNHDLRITFDQNMRWRSTNLDLARGSWGNPIVRTGGVLMEIKIPGSMPVWLSNMLSMYKIFPTSFSKYGECYKTQLVKITSLGGVICA